MTDWYRVGTPEREAVAKYRNPEKIQASEVLDMLLFHVKYNEDASPIQLLDLGRWITSYLEYKEQDVEKGEQIMLQMWKDAVSQ